MQNIGLKTCASTIAIAAFALAGAPAYAQDDTEKEQNFGDVIVVTAVAGSKKQLETSVSVTDVGADTIEAFTPRSEAEVLHLIPGIRAESTAGGGGNSNITVRGLPLASGGSKYVQLQEDGLPVVEYGDIAFGNNDYWLRYDWTVKSVQAVRGGSASTFASQAPGAVINYISKTGEEAGGRIGFTTGLGFDDKRLDFNYGSPVTETLRFHIGGYYRSGTGPRYVPYKALDGYQIKANVTKEFDDGNGYVRFYFKRLDDRAPTYHNAPFEVEVDDDGKITGYAPIPHGNETFDARKNTNFSTYNLSFPTVTPERTVEVGSPNRDGINVKVTRVGAEFHYDLGEVFSVDNKFHYTSQGGTFSAPFYGMNALTTAADLIGTTVNGETVASVKYANGLLAGTDLDSDAVISTTPNLYTRMNDMGHLANDMTLSATFDMAGGELTARAGYYHSRQNIKMDWHWNASYVESTGHNPAMVDLYDATGTALTDNGLSGYNNQWGGCCVRRYDLEYTGHAPYLALNYSGDRLDLDASVRFDTVLGDGYFYGTQAGGPEEYDVNSDGEISIAEENVYFVDISNPKLINYKIGYTSWSVGANYRITPDTAVFIRASKGYRANADRVVSDFGGAFFADGSLTNLGQAVVKNPVTQQELGIKHRGGIGDGTYGVFATFFRSQAKEYNYDLTTQEQTFQKYKTWGVELESQMQTGGFNLMANIVYMSSEISEDLISNNAGNTPRATPKLSWVVSPSYDFNLASVGLSWRGHSKTYPHDDNAISQKGVSVINAFLKAEPIEGLELTLSANNLFNAWDQAGRLDEASVTQLQTTGALFGVPYAATNRVGLGRSFSASIAYKF